MSKVFCELFDASGSVYRVRVLASDVPKLDLDHKLQFRLLLDAKRRGQSPVGTWLSVDSPNVSCASSNVSLWEPSVAGKDTSLSDVDLRSPQKKKKKSVENTEEDLSELNTSFNASINMNDDVSGSDDDSRKIHPTNVIGTEGSVLAGFVTSWAEESAVHALLNEIGARITRFKNEKNHKKLWEEVSTALLNKNFCFSGVECHNKKRSLDTYFSKLLKNKVKNNKDKNPKISWPFYQAMTFIRAGFWPPNFISGQKIAVEVQELDLEVNDEESEEPLPLQPEETGSVEPPFVGALEHLQAAQENEDDAFEVANTAEFLGISCEKNANEVSLRTAHEFHISLNSFDDFDIDADTALSEEYFERKEEFSGKAVSNAHLYKTVASAMLNRGYTCKPALCQRRFQHLQGFFRKRYDQLKMTGAGSCEWELYDLFLQHSGEDNVTLKATVTVSAGSTAKMVQAKKTLEGIRNTKARPQTNDSKQKKAPSTTDSQQKKVSRLVGSHIPRPIGIKNRALDLQERRLDLDREFVNEFSLLRQDFKERGQTLNDGINILRDLKARKNNNNNKEN